MWNILWSLEQSFGVIASGTACGIWISIMWLKTKWNSMWGLEQYIGWHQVERHLEPGEASFGLHQVVQCVVKLQYMKIILENEAEEWELEHSTVVSNIMPYSSAPLLLVMLHILTISFMPVHILLFYVLRLIHLIHWIYICFKSCQTTFHILIYTLLSQAWLKPYTTYLICGKTKLKYMKIKSLSVFQVSDTLFLVQLLFMVSKR